MSTRTPRKTAKPARRTPPVDRTMRLPHEQDESSRHALAPATRVMETAHDDVEAGLIDTDRRGTEAREAFDKHRATDAKALERTSARVPLRRKRSS